MIFREVFISETVFAQERLPRDVVVRHILQGCYRSDEFHYYHGRDHTKPETPDGGASK